MPAAGGVLVEFRDDVSEELLWEARMQSFPQKDEMVGWAVTGGVLVWFEVQRVKYEFRQPVGQPDNGGSSSPSTTLCQCHPIIYISEV